MFTRRHALYLTFAATIALTFFGLGAYSVQRLNARQIAQIQGEIGTLRDQIETMRRPGGAVGTGGTQLQEHPTSTITREVGVTQLPEQPSASASDQPIVAQIKRQLQTEMGLFPLQLFRDRRESFVELYARDNSGKVHYGTAGYLGGGFFITVKHGVVVLGESRRRMTSIDVLYRDRRMPAKIVDAGDADSEVHPGDWAIIQVDESLDLPALHAKVDAPFNFASPLLRLGNDYSNGIIATTGYTGQRTSNGLITCLTDSNPGVSGGGVVDQDGNLVGISVGRMDGSYRFSFILPLRREMFRKAPGPA